MSLSDPVLSRKNLSSLVLSVLAPCCLLAGDPVEEVPAETVFSVTLGASANNGNTDSENLDLATSLSGPFCTVGEYELGAEGHLSRAKANKDDSRRDTTVENGEIDGRISSRRFARASYFYFESSLFSDDVANVDFRANGGGGGGFDLCRSPRLRLSVEGGFSPMWEKINGSTEYHTMVRVAQLYSYSFPKGAAVKAKLEYLPSIADKDKFLVNGSVSLESPLNEWASLALTLKNAFNSQPGAGNDKNDTSVMAGLRLKL